MSGIKKGKAGAAADEASPREGTAVRVLYDDLGWFQLVNFYEETASRTQQRFPLRVRNPAQGDRDGECREPAWTAAAPLDTVARPGTALCSITHNGRARGVGLRTNTSPQTRCR